MKKTKDKLFLLSGVFCACLIISNILAFKTFCIGCITLPAAVVVFPLVYIVNDALTEVYGYEKARQVIWLGFGLNAVAVVAYQIAILLPAPEYFTGQEAFATVLSNSGRILLASFAGYLAGSLLNAKTMAILKERTSLFARCVISTLFGEGVDALLFISIAFVGQMPLKTLFGMIIAQALAKTLYEIIIYPATRKVIKKVQNDIE